jgi:RNA polymerase sigma-70 factor (ECF subfamily)
MQVARHRAIDVLRRQTNLHRKLQQFDSDMQPDQAVAFDDIGGDDQLTLLFIGCHPVLSPDMQVTLLLKTLCGFGVSEIARAFLLPEAAIAQRIVRAKRKIREQKLSFELPPERELANRLDGVLAVLYLLFNEGYNASRGVTLVRDDLCWEAIRLGMLLNEHRLGQSPRVHALLALMWLQASRLAARTSAAGDLLLLAEQDRRLWDQDAIRQGVYHLKRAAAGDELSVYHLQAGIAACHALAPSYAATDWATLLFYYDQLMLKQPSPVFALNRAVVLAMAQGTGAGLAALDQISGLEDYYLLLATYGEFHKRSGQPEQAAQYYRQALARTDNQTEQNFLRRKLDHIAGLPQTP